MCFKNFCKDRDGRVNRVRNHQNVRFWAESLMVNRCYKRKDYFAAAVARFFIIPALMLNKSSRDIPVSVRIDKERNTRFTWDSGGNDNDLCTS